MSKHDSAAPIGAASEPDTAARVNVIAAAEVIADLARAGMPLPSWYIHRDGRNSAGFPGAEGQAADADAVHAFAERWDVEPFDPGFGPAYLYAQAEVHGVHVRVWTLIGDRGRDEQESEA